MSLNADVSQGIKIMVFKKIHEENKLTEGKRKTKIMYQFKKGFDALNGKSIFAHYTNSKTEEIHKKYTDYLTEYSSSHEEVIALPEEDTIFINNGNIEIINSETVKFTLQGLDSYRAVDIRATFDLLSEHHLHILETGELETILEDFKVGYKEKRLWIVEAIQKISEISKDDIKKDSALYRIINGIINS